MDDLLAKNNEKQTTAIVSHEHHKSVFDRQKQWKVGESTLVPFAFVQLARKLRTRLCSQKLSCNYGSKEVEDLRKSKSDAFFYSYVLSTFLR